MAIPKWVELNGARLDFESMPAVPLPLPGRWVMRAAVRGTLVLWAFRDLDYGDVDVHRVVINGTRDLTAPPLKLHYEGDPGFPNLMGSTEGYAWTHDAYLAFRGGQVSTFADAKADAIVDAGKEDVDATRYTGSAGMEFHHWAGMVGRRDGLSRALYRLLDAYLRKQFRRPRWFLAANGLPAGLDGHAVDFVPEDGPDQDPLPGFDEWREDAEGLNALDAQHLDGSELYWGWRLTGNPLFLIALLQLWLSTRWNAYYIRSPEKQWAGSVRVPGWWFILSSFVLEATASVPGMDGLRAAVFDSVRAHLDVLRSGFPIWNPYEKGAQKPWMYAPVLLGLERLVHLSAVPVDVLAHSAGATTDITAWLDQHAIRVDPVSGETLLAYTVHPDPSRSTWMAWKPGVLDWYASLSVCEERPRVTDHVVERLTAWGAAKPTHPYHLSKGVGLMPTLLGFEEWVG